MGTEAKSSVSCYDTLAAAVGSQRSQDELESRMLTEATKQTFLASVWQEDDWYVAQAVGVDLASQGRSPDEALANLRDALELHFEPPVATAAPKLHQLKVEVASS